MQLSRFIVTVKSYHFNIIKCIMNKNIPGSVFAHFIDPTLQSRAVYSYRPTYLIFLFVNFLCQWYKGYNFQIIFFCFIQIVSHNV